MNGKGEDTMVNCKQKAEIFLTKHTWEETPVKEHYNSQDYLKIITTKEIGDFLITIDKGEIVLEFNHIVVKVPKEAFMLETGRLLINELHGGNFIEWALKKIEK